VPRSVRVPARAPAPAPTPKRLAASAPAPPGLLLHKGTVSSSHKVYHGPKRRRLMTQCSSARASGAAMAAMWREPTGLWREPTDLRREPTGLWREPTGLWREPTGVWREPTGVWREPTGVWREPTGLWREACVCERPRGVAALIARERMDREGQADPASLSRPCKASACLQSKWSSCSAALEL
jgi:hypothetical protein